MLNAHNLTAEQKRVLLYKHLTGDFPGQKWSTIEALLRMGLLFEYRNAIVLTVAGREYCDQHHLEM